MFVLRLVHLLCCEQQLQLLQVLLQLLLRLLRLVLVDGQLEEVLVLLERCARCAILFSKICVLNHFPDVVEPLYQLLEVVCLHELNDVHQLLRGAF